MKNLCPLCQSRGKQFYSFKTRLYNKCIHCKGIFVDRSLVPDPDAEKKRYLEHINDVEDSGYQKFVLPITSAILKQYTPAHKGLDFGAGTGPVISKLLKDKDYTVQLYDPFFHKNTELLKNTYDYIVCCEVIEHFHHPFDEFQLLKKLLKTKGKLFCMTNIYNQNIDFHTWHYKNDPTHVFIYQKPTLYWIQKEVGFSDLSIDDRLIVFQK